MRRRHTLKVTPSTGNVFRDIGFSAQESEHLLVRANLLLQLQKTLVARELTQVQAARCCRSLSRVSAICFAAASISSALTA
jgi:hypothetical protein